MTHFYDEHRLRQQMHELSALDRQLERWRWFRRHEHRPRKSGWLIQAGEALIRLGRWLQERGGAQPVRTPGGL
ncbi:MAG TPA: hypothetical protein VLM91_17815 [Candidatus Methylomirabilis sp.]|nr:hypothetical protein [Candidatus Methylomirabilis sp.]